MPATGTTSQTVDRAMAVLNAVAEHGACRMADIASLTGLERRIAGRLVASLAAAHLIEPGESGRYELGTRLIELGHAAERRNGLRAKARPVAEALMREVGATVIVHRVHDNDMTPLVVSMPTDVLALSYPDGRRIPLHVGTGRAALAWRPEEQIQALLDKAGSSLEEDGWRTRLEDIRAAGVAVSYGEVTRGVTAVGSAVRRADGLPVATLVVIAPEGAHPERHAAKVAKSAKALSDLLRVPGPS